MERLVARYLAGESPFQTQVGTTSDGAILLTEASGCALFGPYVTLPAGRYTARILFATETLRTGRVTLDIAARNGKIHIREALFDLEHLPSKNGSIEIDFDIDRKEHGCEIRLICHDHVSAYISSVELEIHHPENGSLLFFREDPFPQYKMSIKQDWVSSPYYDLAEKDLQSFWSEDSPFVRMFNTLDLANVVELACGHGRHAAYILENYSLGHLTLVDINKQNIRFCKNRFAGNNRFSYLTNLGSDLAGLATGKYSAIFCYDAMVHFEYDDVISYLKEMHRIMCPGGRALLHHSNYDTSPGASYADNPHWRNFMSSTLFAHAAMRGGFVVVEQQLVDWGGEPKLDCVTLLENPGMVGDSDRGSQMPWRRPWSNWWRAATSWSK